MFKDTEKCSNNAHLEVGKYELWEIYMTMGICSLHYILKVEEKIPWTEEPDGSQSIGSQRVGHDQQLTFFLL